ncbi:MAG: hypothetical protein HY850_09325 [Betaproteobacteria bacterium]|nr:hypothetical protein [Betaproteobacteria bacterium]
MSQAMTLPISPEPDGAASNAAGLRLFSCWRDVANDAMPLPLAALAGGLAGAGLPWAAWSAVPAMLSLLWIWRRRRRARQARVELLQFAAAVEAGDLTARMRPGGTNDVALIEGMNSMARAYVRLLGNLARSARELASSASESSANASHGNAGVHAQREVTLASAATLEQLSVSLSSTSDNAVEAARLADAANRAACQGSDNGAALARRMGSIGAGMDETSRMAKQLNARSVEIGGIVETIAAIAAQTNLLALNAAIEAARAGEAGRGFAVVADEVRRLAERTKTATDEIQALIEGLQGDVGSVFGAIDQAGVEVTHGQAEAGQVLSMLAQIARQIEQTQVAVREIADASTEQSRASQSLAADVEQVAGLAERNEALVHDNQELARYLEQMSHQLGELLQSYRYE